VPFWLAGYKNKRGRWRWEWTETKEKKTFGVTEYMLFYRGVAERNN
jgi:hypothetical protein